MDTHDFKCRISMRLAPFLGSPAKSPAKRKEPSPEDMQLVEEWWNTAESTLDDGEPLPVDELYKRAAQVKGGLNREDISDVDHAYHTFIRNKFLKLSSECNWGQQEKEGKE